MALVIAWFAGTVALFRKGHQGLGWTSVAGFIIPFLGVVGYAGFFLLPKPTSQEFENADGWMRTQAAKKYPDDYRR
ncbi:MAG: hypothetical protein ACR2N7_02485 [Acidimicrobiia bacterium]